MRCPYCNEISSQVIDSRPTEDATGVRRRRKCKACGKRYTTYERIETNEEAAKQAAIAAHAKAEVELKKADSKLCDFWGPAFKAMITAGLLDQAEQYIRDMPHSVSKVLFVKELLDARDKRDGNV